MREREHLWRSSFMSLGFTFAIGAHSISKEVAGFSPLCFPRGKFFVSLVSCDFCYSCYSLRYDPRSYCLNDKNITNTISAVDIASTNEYQWMIFVTKVPLWNPQRIRSMVGT